MSPALSALLKGISAFRRVMFLDEGLLHQKARSLLGILRPADLTVQQMEHIYHPHHNFHHLQHHL